MEKIIQITINSTLFSIEENAYQKLSIYLTEIKSVFDRDENGSEIIKDIEARIAELFKAGGGEFVSLALVEAVKEKMGSAYDLSGKDKKDGQETVSREKEKDGMKRRLFRDEENAILGGVCSGIAAYIEVDPTWVRISFIILAFLGFGLIIPIYLILWFIIPEATTISEKLDMHGVSSSLKSIVHEVKSRIEDLRNKHKCCDKNFNNTEENNKECSQICKKNFNGLGGRVLKIIDRLTIILGVMFRVIVGAIITICGLAVLVAFFVAIAALVSSGIPISIDALITTNGLEPYITALVIASIAAFLIPALLVFYAGIAILTGKTRKKKTHVFLTLCIWMLAITIIVFTLTHIGIKIATYSNDNNQIVITKVIINDSIEVSKDKIKELGEEIRAGVTQK